MYIYKKKNMYLHFYFILSVLDILNQIKHDYPVLFRSNIDIRTIYWNIKLFFWLIIIYEFTV